MCGPGVRRSGWCRRLRRLSWYRGRWAIGVRRSGWCRRLRHIAQKIEFPRHKVSVDQVGADDCANSCLIPTGRWDTCPSIRLVPTTAPIRPPLFGAIRCSVRRSGWCRRLRPRELLPWSDRERCPSIRLVPTTAPSGAVGSPAREGPVSVDQVGADDCARRPSNPWPALRF